MEEEQRGRTLLMERFSQMQRWKMIKGLLFFPLSSLLIMLVGYFWDGGTDWILAAILTATGLYGFVNLLSGTRMTEFDASPIGRFLSGKSGKYTFEVLLIQHSDDSEVQSEEKYEAAISFVEKSGVKVNVSISGRETCRQIIDYLKEQASGRCVIMEMTFQEYIENRREYLQTR